MEMRKGGAGNKTNPPPPEWTEIAGRRSAESEMRKGDQVTTSTPPNRTDRDIVAAVRRVGGA